ncbi:MAG: enoyl-CoA hydratase/isomerase family protein, partial [Gemmatimonadetes bacterium]|nr:enoyl-CoA hydratase/isomerase family protein [Gemmatimonadota bacterium]
MTAVTPRAPADLGFREVLYAKRDGVARITLNRPQRYNAYSTEGLDELAAAFRDAAFDDAVGVIVYTGAGDRAFCTGGDVKEYATTYVPKPRDYWKYMALFRAYIESILNTGKPVVARINGMAVGGGNESQLACDLSVMAQHAYLKQVGTHVGSVACGGATQWLPLTIGDKRAREVLLLNEPIPARKALEWGLVNWVVPSVRRGDQWIEEATAEEIRKAERGEDGHRLDLDRLDAFVDDLARRLLASFPECVRYTKQQTNFLKDFVW